MFFEVKLIYACLTYIEYGQLNFRRMSAQPYLVRFYKYVSNRNFSAVKNMVSDLHNLLVHR